MTDKEWLGIASIALSAIGYSSYILSVLKKHTKPHVFSWGVWALIMSVVFFAQFSQGAGAGAWVTGFSAAMCCVITVLSLWRGEKHITRSDWAAFLGALLTIPLWYITKNPLWAVVLATLVDALAYFPTFRKSWYKPREEHFFTYCMDAVKWIFALCALQNYSLVTLLYPCFLLIANTTLVSMIVWRRAASKAVIK